MATQPGIGIACRFDLGALSPGAWLAACLAQETAQRRLFGWLPVAFGLGIVLFFAAEGEPALWAPLAAAGLLAGGAAALRQHPLAMGVLVAGCALFCGFAAGVIRTWLVGAPVLARMEIGPVSGFLESVEERTTGGRIVLRVHALGRLSPEARPARVRLTLKEIGALRPGDFLSLSARVLPPPEPARPGGYDFAREAYFRGIGGVGSALGRVATGPPPVPVPWDLRIAAAVDDARNRLTRRIADAIGGQAGAVAAALVTGKRGLIDEDTNDALRAAGIFHIVSISGLHMALAAGTLFWALRASLAFAPGIALVWPVKKIAALVAMAGATAYCVFSGSEVATVRSLITTLVMLGAILADRPALSLRNLAIAALIVLAREPESLLGPSFQMSFAAVGALVASGEIWRARVGGRPPPVGPFDRALRYGLGVAGGLLGTTLVASIATAPFGSYHFQLLNPFGIVGNALALPLVSFVVMPAAVLGVMAAPFGLDRPVWTIMGLAIEKVLEVSAWVEGFAGANVIVPAFGALALSGFVLAILIAVIPVSGLRWLALPPALAGLWLAADPPRPDLYVDREGNGAAVRGADGRLVVVGRPGNFTVEQWLRADGDAREADEPSVRAPARCDPLGCVVTLADGRAVSFVTDRRALQEDCGRASVVVTRLTAPPGCLAGLLLDRTRLSAGGAVSVTLGPSVRVVESARGAGEPRLWMRPRPKPTPAPAQGFTPEEPREEEP